MVALANIAPALVAKAVWPYLLKGKVRYKKRVWGCSALSFLGMLVSLLFNFDKIKEKITKGRLKGKARDDKRQEPTLSSP